MVGLSNDEPKESIMQVHRFKNVTGLNDRIRYVFTRDEFLEIHYNKVGKILFTIRGKAIA